MSAPVDVLAVIAQKLAAAVVAGMIMEAAYRGEAVGAEDIAECLVSDPSGETACYFRRSAADAVELYSTFRNYPELLAIFPARVGGAK